MAENYGLYNIDRNGNVKLVPEAYKLCPELLSLSKENLKYIILVYDRGGSPLARLPEEERKMSAKRIVWKTDGIDPESIKEVQEGIEYYSSLIYDPRQETVDVFKDKLHKLNQKFKTETDYNEYAVLEKAITIVNKRLKESEEDLNKEEEKVILRGGNTLSLLEKLRRNKKLWNELKKPTHE